MQVSGPRSRCPGFVRLAVAAMALIFAAVPTSAQNVGAQDVSEEDDEAEQEAGLAGFLGGREIRSTLQIFGDLGFRYNKPELAGRAESGFALGTLDIFSNVQIGEEFRALAEIVIDSEADGSYSLSMERLWGMLIFDDALNVKIGTDHSALSRWNQVYHHGSFLETTITRPFLAQFEGGSGFMPLHHTGIEASGTFLPEVGTVEYFLTIGNGRGIEPSDKQQGRDQNNNKKVDVGVAFLPDCIPDLRIGLAGAYDEIPPDPTSANPERALGMRELIGTAHVECRVLGFDVLIEHAWVRHTTRVQRREYSSGSGYAQVAYPSGALTTFTRFDYRNLRNGDPYLHGRNRDLDTWQQILGFRYDVSKDVSIKFEVGVGRGEFRNSRGGVYKDDMYSGAFQLAWHL